MPQPAPPEDARLPGLPHAGAGRVWPRVTLCGRIPREGTVQLAMDSR